MDYTWMDGMSIRWILRRILRRRLWWICDLWLWRICNLWLGGITWWVLNLWLGFWFVINRSNLVL